MAKSAILDRTFHAIIERLIATGEAPNYAQLAADLGVSPAEGQIALRKLFKTLGFPGWFQPKTDNIVSFAPFNNTPSNYRITIDGEQKWYGQ